MNFYSKVYEIVKLIPHGKVSTYGKVATLAGSPRAARATGYALYNLHDNDLEKVPWQRVINAQGKISFRGDLVRATLQKKLLEQEGIYFDHDEKIDLKRYGWP